MKISSPNSEGVYTGPWIFWIYKRRPILYIFLRTVIITDGIRIYFRFCEWHWKYRVLVFELAKSYRTYVIGLRLTKSYSRLVTRLMLQKTVFFCRVIKGSIAVLRLYVMKSAPFKKTSQKRIFFSIYQLLCFPLLHSTYA